MESQQGHINLPLTRAEAQELLARLLLSHCDDNAISAALMKRIALAMEATPASRCAA